jgi:hypothetical protein
MLRKEVSLQALYLARLLWGGQDHLREVLLRRLLRRPRLQHHHRSLGIPRAIDRTFRPMRRVSSIFSAPICRESRRRHQQHLRLK